MSDEVRKRNGGANPDNDDLINFLCGANIPVLLVDKDLRLRRFTPAAEKLLNLTASDLGRPITDLPLKIEGPPLEDRLRDVIESSGVHELRVRDLDGRLYSMVIRPYQTMDNRIYDLFVTLLDITERERAAEARYARLFETATEGILIADAANGDILEVNPSLLMLLNCRREDLIGHRLLEADAFRSNGLDERWLSEVNKKGIVQRELALAPSTGRAVRVELKANSYAEGSLQLIRLNIRDVTFQQQLEERLRRSEEQVRQAEKMEAIGQLASGIAHDFNNLMTAVMARCQLLQSGRDPSDSLVREVNEVITVVERAAKLSQQLLAFGRKQSLQPKLLDMNRVLADVKPMIDSVVKENVKFEIKPDRALGMFRADRGQIEQIILNLAINARDAMPDGGRFTAEAADAEVNDDSKIHPAIPPGRYVRLTLADTGIGMSLEVQSHLFEPFFTTKPRGIGTGLGLSSTYGIVRQSDAHILVKSELGHGTVVSIYFPSLDVKEDESAAPTETSHEDRGARVLLVEDEECLRRPLAMGLKRSGYTVLEAASGPQALEMDESHQGPIDLVITDVLMPAMSGRDLANKLRARRPGLKVLYMSGQAAEEMVHQGMLDEGVALLYKPFTIQKLVSKVAQVLSTEDGGKPSS